MFSLSLLRISSFLYLTAGVASNSRVPDYLHRGVPTLGAQIFRCSSQNISSLSLNLISVYHEKVGRMRNLQTSRVPMQIRLMLYRTVYIYF